MPDPGDARQQAADVSAKLLCNVRKSKGVWCPLVSFECGHDAYIWPDEYGDGSAWCQACGEFRCYDRCPECFSFDCDHREEK